MTRAALALACALAASAAQAGGYMVLQPPDDTSTLSLKQAGRTIRAPKTEHEQEGFWQPRVSADGRTVGWVAETANCCTSYPLPTVLVLYRGGKVIRRFPEVPPIWEWQFGPGPDEVVTRQAYPHGQEYFTYSRLRISDGKLLAQFECNQDEPVKAVRPAWARIVEEDCPDYMPPPPEESASAPDGAASSR